jgi:hypothetical protein
MTNSHTTTDRPSTTARPSRARGSRPVAVPRTRTESLELRELLEANLEALQTLHEEHHRMLDRSLRAIDTMCIDLRTELRAISNVRAPWVRALSETRALLFVALRELIVGAHEAELSMHLPQQDADPAGSR